MPEVVMHDQHFTFARVGRYNNARVCYALVDANGEEVYRVSVNVPDVALGKQELLVKDYTENTGMLAALLAAGVVRDTGTRIPSGFVDLPLVELVGTPPEAV